MARIGIYGGTFNPPHNGHLHAAEAAYHAMALDRVILIPANIPPHKTLPTDSADANTRYEMVCLAASSYPWMEVSDLELRTVGKNYTVDTLEKLKTLYPNDALFLIIGTDMLLTLDRWYRPERLLSLVPVIAVGRDHGDLPELYEARERLKRQFQAVIYIVEEEPLPVSSTQIRSWSEDEIKKYVPEAVLCYMRQKKLYWFHGEV